jgi:adenosylhomocysteine nucleosidase
MSLVAIIGAMDEEITLIQEWLVDVRHEVIAGCEFFLGTLDGKQVILLKSGIGKVNAAVSTTLLLSKYAPNYVINIGSAGGLDQALNVGDVVIGDQVVHHDVDVTAFGYPLGQVPSMPAVFTADERLATIAHQSLMPLDGVVVRMGLIGTGDSFMSDPERVHRVQTQFPNLVAVEMEAAAVAQVCHKFTTPFVIVRALSDIAGKSSSKSFEEFLPIAARNSSIMIRTMLKAL